MPSPHTIWHFRLKAQSARVKIEVYWAGKENRNYGFSPAPPTRSKSGMSDQYLVVNCSSLSLFSLLPQRREFLAFSAIFLVSFFFLVSLQHSMQIFFQFNSTEKGKGGEKNPRNKFHLHNLVSPPQRAISAADSISIQCMCMVVEDENRHTKKSFNCDSLNTGDIYNSNFHSHQHTQQFCRYTPNLKRVASVEEAWKKRESGLKWAYNVNRMKGRAQEAKFYGREKMKRLNWVEQRQKREFRIQESAVRWQIHNTLQLYDYCCVNVNAMRKENGEAVVTLSYENCWGKQISSVNSPSHLFVICVRLFTSFLCFNLSWQILTRFRQSIETIEAHFYMEKSWIRCCCLSIQ